VSCYQPNGFVFDMRGRDVEAAQLDAGLDKETCRWRIIGDAGPVRRSAEREGPAEGHGRATSMSMPAVRRSWVMSKGGEGSTEIRGSTPCKTDCPCT
jgi:hypothetical protein